MTNILTDLYLTLAALVRDVSPISEVGLISGLLIGLVVLALRHWGDDVIKTLRWPIGIAPPALLTVVGAIYFYPLPVGEFLGCASAILCYSAGFAITLVIMHVLFVVYGQRMAEQEMTIHSFAEEHYAFRDRYLREWHERMNKYEQELWAKEQALDRREKQIEPPTPTRPDDPDIDRRRNDDRRFDR